MTAWALRDRAAIVGIGETPYTKRGGTATPEFALACRAIRAAIWDAGLELADVDGLVAYGAERNTIDALAQTLGLGLRYHALHPIGGNAACGIVQHAAMAVATGTARHVVCYRAICQGQFPRLGGPVARGASPGPKDAPVAEVAAGPQAFLAPFGLIAPVHRFAMEARRHMHLYGTTSRHFGAVAVAAYAHAQRNPRAVMNGHPLDIEQHQASRMIADPYRLFDCCQESDGACAVVVASTDAARHLRTTPVLIAGAAQGMVETDGPDLHARQKALWASARMSGIAEDVYARAGVAPREIDTVQIYETFTGQVLMSLEDFGFCDRGESGPFAEDGNLLWPLGSLPFNTAGGNLAEGYIHGLSLVLEAVRQLRNDSTAQVEGAEHCLVASATVPASSALILRRSS